MRTRTIGGLVAGGLALLSAGCSSSSSAPSTTTAAASTTTSSVGTTPSTADFTGGKATFKDWAVGDVTVQGDQAVITFTGTACQGGQCVSNSDPKAATNSASAIFAGSTFAEAFATADNPNSQNSPPFVAAAVQQRGWRARAR